MGSFVDSLVSLWIHVTCFMIAHLWISKKIDFLKNDKNFELSMLEFAKSEN